MLQESQEGYTSNEQYNAFAVLSDRRSNPYIRTRQRRSFDRRSAMRVGINAMTFIRENGKILTGRLLDISDTGGNIELDASESIKQPVFTIGIPLLSGKQISCEKIWSCNDNERSFRCGVRFIDLTPRDRTELRKRYLLDPGVISGYADNLTRLAKTSEQQEEIRTFFLIDVRRAMEKLIDIDHKITEGASDEYIMHRCTETLDELLAAGERLSTVINDEIAMKEVKQRVRVLLGHFIYQSTAFRRAFEKPRGYPGDYKTLELVYDDKVVSRGIGKYLDKYGINAPYSQAIRMRKDLMREMLHDFIAGSSRPELHILNLASGGCREIRELLGHPLPYKGRVRFVCIDQDEQAIDFARERLSAYQSDNCTVEFVRGNILKLESLDIGPEEGFDMIYSIGIADYLQDRMLKKIFHDSFKKLAPGGKLVVAYKDKDKHKPVAFHWYGDWYFIPRNEEELLNLIYETLPKEALNINIQREPTGIIFFVVITKIK